MPYRYQVVDVFTTQPLEGNPLAVFPDASGIHELMMQKIAQRTESIRDNFCFTAEPAGLLRASQNFHAQPGDGLRGASYHWHEFRTA